MDKLKMDRSKNIFIRRIGFMLVALIGLLLALAVQAADSTQLSGHKGDVNSVAVSADGTLVVSAGDGTVYLIDLHGKVVHTWRMPYPAGQYGYLTEKGTLFYNGKIPNETFLGKSPFMGGVALEADWNGRILWEVRQPNHHHDGRLRRTVTCSSCVPRNCRAT